MERLSSGQWLASPRRTDTNSCVPTIVFGMNRAVYRWREDNCDLTLKSTFYEMISYLWFFDCLGLEQQILLDGMTDFGQFVSLMDGSVSCT